MVLINFHYCKNHRPKPLPNSLSVKNLSCTRSEKTLFDALEFSVNASCCLHVTGSNGSGKTSLLRMLCGLFDVDNGDIRWNGDQIKNNQAFFNDLAYIGHKDGIKNELSAAENLSFYQALNNRADPSLVDDYLARMGILASADLAAQVLSFGQRRRLAFARLLITNHSLWILDEPFTGIDHAGRKLIESICLDHLLNNGIIILTHHQSLATSSLAPHLDELKL